MSWQEKLFAIIKVWSCPGSFSIFTISGAKNIPIAILNGAE